MGSAASADTGVKDSPSSARSSSSGPRSRATPVTCAPALLKAVAMPRPKPRLAPVTSAVAPSSSLSGITILLRPRVSRRFVGRPTDIDQPDSGESPRARVPNSGAWPRAWHDGDGNACTAQGDPRVSCPDHAVQSWPPRGAQLVPGAPARSGFLSLLACGLHAVRRLCRNGEPGRPLWDSDAPGDLRPRCHMAVPMPRPRPGMEPVTAQSRADGPTGLPTPRTLSWVSGRGG